MCLEEKVDTRLPCASSSLGLPAFWRKVVGDRPSSSYQMSQRINALAAHCLRILQAVREVAPSI